MSSERLRVAVATVWDGGAKFECALTLWCASAAALLSAVGGGGSIVVLGTEKASPECAAARYVLPKRSAEAVRAYDVVRRGGVGKFINVLKVALFAFFEYDVVLFSDLDVDLAPWPTPWAALGRRPEAESAWLARWHASIDAFMRSRVQLVASPDHASPISTGVMLLKPCGWLHEAALSLLRRNLSFSPESGFNGCGASHRLAMDERVLAAGFGPRNASAAERAVHARLLRTTARTSGAWRFAAADIDQGLFYYFFYSLHRGHATWAEANSPSWNVDHYWGPLKPWRPSGIDHMPTSAVRYLWRLAAVEGSLNTRCVGVLQGLRERLRSRGVWFDAPTAAQPRAPRRGLRSIARFSILPSPRVAEFVLT